MRHEFDIAIIGAGPGGIAAACVASESGRRVCVLDDNAAPGGQIWRGGAINGHSRRWIERFEKSGAVRLHGHTVISANSKSLRAETIDGVVEVNFEKLILATGSRELFLPFPGWTSPRVIGVGGLQALFKAGLSVKGKRIVFAGSGPLMMAVPGHLKYEGGAIIELIAEQASFGKLLKFATGLYRTPRKIGQAMALKWHLMGVPMVFNSWPLRAVDNGHELSVTLQIGKKQKTIACDYLASSFGLVPNVELAQLVGCDLNADGFVIVNDQQQTSLANVYAIGELTGIGGVEKSLTEGEIAGYCAAGDADKAKVYAPLHALHKGFVEKLKSAFALRPELLQLADDSTVVCRCEDVTLGRLKHHISSRDAKLQTRCGMGPCQGRVCGPMLRAIKGWGDTSVRPPVASARMGSLIHSEIDKQY